MEEEQSKIWALKIQAWKGRESSEKIRGREEAEGGTGGPTKRKKRRYEEREDKQKKKKGKIDLKVKMKL